MSELVKDLGSDLRNVYLMARFELLKQVKRRRILMMVILAILLPLIFYVVPPAFDIDYPDHALSFASLNLGFITLLIIISGAIFAGDAITSEFEKKTGLLLFPSPQRGTTIFVGKYIAATLAVFLVVSLYYLITILEMAQIYGGDSVTVAMGKSYLLALIYSAAVVSIIYFLSAIFRKSITSSILGFFFLMMILPIITMVLMLVDVDPWWSVTFQADLISDVLGTGSSGSFRAGDGPGEGMDIGSFAPDFYTGTYVMVAHAIIFFITAVIFAERRRME
jgi:ABC-2 type transport system permease protein